MPPKLEQPPIPVGRGHDAARWLEYHNIVPRVPSIRSSDIGYLDSPFQYYLSRRLGLTPIHYYSEALSLGTWFHNWFEVHQLPDALGHYERKIAEARTDLEAKASVLRWSSRQKADIIQQLEHDATHAREWFEIAVDIPIGNSGTLRAHMNRPVWKTLGREVFLRVYHPKMPKTSLVAQFDQLWYHTEHNTLWVPDLKSTGQNPRDRGAKCPVEFQTWHYLMVLEMALESGALHDQFPELPPNVKIGGMMHYIIQKPTIRLSQKDRDYNEIRKEISRGPNKGSIRIEKEYYGEPSWDNYRKRVKDWYLGEGEYETAHQSGPPVEISTTQFSTLDDDVRHEYGLHLSQLYELATKTAIPCSFPRNANSMGHHGGLTPYAKFYTLGIQHWPRIIREQQLIPSFRDPELDEGDTDD
jgi:hypothetical protein